MKHERKQQKFDQDISIVKAGKKIHLYSMIQAAREDTEIRPTLEKYGSIEPLETKKAAIYGDFSEIKDLRDIEEARIKADTMWDNLPARIKRHFDHDKKRFMEEGEEWLRKELEEDEKASRAYARKKRIESIKEEEEIRKEAIGKTIEVKNNAEK